MSNKFRPYLDLEVVQSLRRLYPRFPKSQDDTAFLNWYLICQLTGSLETIKDNPAEELDIEEDPKQRDRRNPPGKSSKPVIDLLSEEAD